MKGGLRYKLRQIALVKRKKEFKKQPKSPKVLMSRQPQFGYG